MGKSLFGRNCRNASLQLGALVATAAAGLLAGCDWDTRASELREPYLHRVAVHTVDIQPRFFVEREFAGEVQASQSSQLGFEFPGQVEAVLVDEGDGVVEGQVLARLDTRLLQAERDQLNAQAAELQAELDTARRNLARVERLQAERLVSERERDDLAGRVQVLEASVQRVQAALESNRVRFDKAELRAPFTASVAARQVDGGTVVDAGMPVFTLVQSGGREVRAGVPARLVEDLSLGDEVTIRSGQRRTEGTLVGLGPVVDAATRNRALRVAIEQDWAPGELAYLELATPVDTAGAWLPGAAVTEGLRGTWVVYAAVPAGDGRAELELRSVVVHHARGAELFVSGALEPGDQVVAAGLHRLAPGQSVRTEPQAELLADVRAGH